MVRFLPFLLCAATVAQSFDWRAINEETLRHYTALVQMDSTNPPGNETKVAEYTQGDQRSSDRSGGRRA